ncbi:DUF4097 family beta strand repeat protein [Flavobacterium sp. AG291]|uniref:DUF4097 family beta strand repeat protein n=1 Tax=Flavobacterium sp. AG291 TaxID=2184000 RepID=UPI000E0C722D|nr:DUF4097 family beta strand repeat protein [Flavobacterium sp. AG291]RDI13308.1 putative adhesin [Flavobacterium sp. AG291]
MKTIMHKLTLLLLMLPCLALAGNGVKGGKYTKEKRIAKAYIVNADCGLQVNNQFGNIYVTTWDENKTQIEVVIKVSGNNEERVIRRIESINIDLNATVALVKASTSIGNMSGGNNLSMEINYTIKIPKRGGINLSNQYGGITTGKINGKANIDCQYGKVTVDELNADSNKITIQYCDSSKLNYIKSGNVNAQYSSLNIVKTDNIKLVGQYSDMRVSEVNMLNYRTEYGDLSVNTVDTAVGTGEYSALRFGLVSGDFNCTTGYGDIKIGALGKDSKNVTINAAYSNVSLNYTESVPFDFEFSVEYAGVRGASGLKFTEKREGDYSARYKGYNKAQGVNRMYIKSEYGDINLGKN